MKILTMRRSRHLAVLAATLVPTVALANTAIETETAQIGAKGDFNFSQSLQMEKLSDGYAMGTLTQFEYGITSRAEILIEPFFQEWEFPTGGATIHGLGDLEITPSYEIIRENSWVPATLLAFKLKARPDHPRISARASSTTTRTSSSGNTSAALPST